MRVAAEVRRRQSDGVHHHHHTNVGEAIGSEGTKGIGGCNSEQGGGTEGKIGALAGGSQCAHYLH